MDRLTFDGNYCEDAKCWNAPQCAPSAFCIQRQTWDRLKAIEDILGDRYDLEELRQIMGTRSLIGKTVYCIRRRIPERNGLHGRTRPHDCQVSTPGALRLGPGELYVAEKKCVQSDLQKLGVLVFTTREDAEAVIGGSGNG